jgi:hypothetical protein
MTKEVKNASKVNNSSLSITLVHETELQLKQATSLPEITNVLITLCEQLGNKVELHVNFVIQSTVYGHNLSGDYSSLVVGDKNIAISHSNAIKANSGEINGSNNFITGK